MGENSLSVFLLEKQIQSHFKTFGFLEIIDFGLEGHSKGHLCSLLVRGWTAGVHVILGKGQSVVGGTGASEG